MKFWSELRRRNVLRTAALYLVSAWLILQVTEVVSGLAFDNMSDDPSQEYFSDGMSEEILGTLAGFPELSVISRSSSFSFKGKNLDAPTIARQLGVAHILEGSVRKSGNQVRISAQLIDAATDSHLWSGTYERKLTAANVFDIQSQIARNIADALNTVLADGKNAGVPRFPTENLEALEAYLLGKQQMALRTRSA